MEPYSTDVIWLVVGCFLVAFVLAFGIGANDVANSFGTSVGAKVLTIMQACCLATVFEISGSVLIGYKVSDTMRKGILDVSLYQGAEEELMAGCFSCLAGSAVWLILATYLKLPISGTHSIVGATVGFSLICRGTSGLKWNTLGFIVMSWFVSPILSGFISVILYALIRHFILMAKAPLTVGFRVLPFFYGITITINIFSVLHDGSKILKFDNIPLWGAVVLSIIIGLGSALLVQFVLVPWLKRKIIEDVTKPRIIVQFSCGSSSDLSTEGSPKEVRFDNALEAGGGGRGGAISSVMANSNSKAVVVSPASTGNDISLPTITKSERLSGGTDRTDEGMMEKESEMNSKVLSSHDNGGLDLETEKIGNGNQVVGVGGEKLAPIAAISGQSSPSSGLSPNNSAVPLIKEASLEPNHDGGQEVAPQELEDDQTEVSGIFSFLQVLTACFGSFAHGGNDVSNAIGPLIAVWLIFTEGSVLQKSETPLYILLYGGVGISVGLWIWGRRVIQTVGEDLTKITPVTGFTIEIGAAMTVLLASKIGIPISTTHCKVGSVVFVGFVRASKSGVDWKLFRNIIYAWVITVPATAFLSASFMVLFKLLSF